MKNPAMTYAELERKLTKCLTRMGVESARSESAWILTELTELPPLERALAGQREVAPTLLKTVKDVMRRRLRREPLQYIFGRTYFRKLTLTVNRDVLIPRPETELLVDWVLRHAPVNGKILELGTGSGAIALSCADERPDLRITATDVSSAALAVAAENARLLQIEGIDFRLGDLYDAVAATERFDLIAANLPYVSCEELAELAPEVRLYEPVLALTAAQDGMELLFRAADGLSQHLLPGGEAIFELSPRQAAPLLEKLRRNGFSGTICQDYTGRERFVCAKKEL